MTDERAEYARRALLAREAKAGLSTTPISPRHISDAEAVERVARLCDLVAAGKPRAGLETEFTAAFWAVDDKVWAASGWGTLQDMWALEAVRDLAHEGPEFLARARDMLRNSRELRGKTEARR